MPSSGGGSITPEAGGIGERPLDRLDGDDSADDEHGGHQRRGHQRRSTDQHATPTDPACGSALGPAAVRSRLRLPQGHASPRRRHGAARRFGVPRDPATSPGPRRSPPAGTDDVWQLSIPMKGDARPVASGASGSSARRSADFGVRPAEYAAEGWRAAAGHGGPVLGRRRRPDRPPAIRAHPDRRGTGEGRERITAPGPPPGRRAYFTEPAVRPRTKKRCRERNTATGMTSTMNDPAATRFQP